MPAAAAPGPSALREARAPLSDFVAKTLTTPLLFTPGTDFSYQSMGILLAATIVERLAAAPPSASEATCAGLVQTASGGRSRSDWR